MKTMSERAREIMEREGVPFIVARVRAAKEAYGIQDASRPLNKRDIATLAVDGSIVPFATLLEASTDDRCSPETRIMASDKYLAHAAKFNDDAASDDGPTFLDPDPDV